MHETAAPTQPGRERSLTPWIRQAHNVQRGDNMTTQNATQKPRVATHEDWLQRWLELLEAEKALSRHSDEVARQRQALPWVRIDRNYVFDTDEGSSSLKDLFRGRTQLLIYHFMFGPDFKAGCPSRSMIADAFNGSFVQLAHHD